MTMAKKLPLLAPSIHTFEVNGTYTDCEAKRTVFMAIQKMVSAGKYYRIPYHGSSKKGYSYKRKDGGLTITLADYPDFKKRYITLSGVNLARIAGDPSRLSLTDLSPEGLVMQEQAFLDELEQLGLLKIEESVKWKMHRLDITQEPLFPVHTLQVSGNYSPCPDSSQFLLGLLLVGIFHNMSLHLVHIFQPHILNISHPFRLVHRQPAL